MIIGNQGSCQLYFMFRAGMEQFYQPLIVHMLVSVVFLAYQWLLAIKAPVSCISCLELGWSNPITTFDSVHAHIRSISNLPMIISNQGSHQLYFMFRAGMEQSYQPLIVHMLVSVVFLAYQWLSAVKAPISCISCLELGWSNPINLW